MTHPLYITHSPTTEDTEGSDFVTLKGKKYRVFSIVHCFVREQSDIRIWVPFNAPFKKTSYAIEMVPFENLSKKQQDRFFTLKSRRKIWGKNLKT
jgi:hypothetical protein